MAKHSDINIYLNLFCNFLTVIMLTNPELLNNITLNMKALIIWLFYVISNFTYCCIQSMQNKTLNVCYTWQRICKKKIRCCQLAAKKFFSLCFLSSPAFLYVIIYFSLTKGLMWRTLILIGALCWSLFCYFIWTWNKMHVFWP